MCFVQQIIYLFQSQSFKFRFVSLSSPKLELGVSFSKTVFHICVVNLKSSVHPVVGLAVGTADGGEKAGVALYKGYTIYTLAPLRALVTVEPAQNVMLMSRFFFHLCALIIHPSFLC